MVTATRPKGECEIRCIICGILIDSIEWVIDARLVPYFHEGDKQHEPACREYSESRLQIHKNGEMELKEEYRGKIKYLYGREPAESLGSGWVIGSAVTEEDQEQMH